MTQHPGRCAAMLFLAALFAASALAGAQTPTANFSVTEFVNPAWEALPAAQQIALRAPAEAWVARANAALADQSGDASSENAKRWLEVLADAPPARRVSPTASARSRLARACPSAVLEAVSGLCLEKGDFAALGLRRDVERELAARLGSPEAASHLLNAARCELVLARGPREGAAKLQVAVEELAASPEAAAEAQALAEGVSRLATLRGAELANESFEMALEADNRPIADTINGVAMAVADSQDAFNAFLAQAGLTRDAEAEARMLSVLSRQALYDWNMEAMDWIVQRSAALGEAASGAPLEPLARVRFHQAMLLLFRHSVEEAEPLFVEAALSGLEPAKAAEAYYNAAYCRRQRDDYAGYEEHMLSALTLAEDDFAVLLEQELAAMRRLGHIE